MLNVSHNYFDGLITLFSDLFLVKFLEIKYLFLEIKYFTKIIHSMYIHLFNFHLFLTFISNRNLTLSIKVLRKEN